MYVSTDNQRGNFLGTSPNNFSESPAPLGRPPHFPFGISSASCSRWVNLSSQHPPIFNCTLPLMYIHKNKKKDAIHAVQGAGRRQGLQICIGTAETCKTVPPRELSAVQEKRQSRTVTWPSRGWLFECVSCLNLLDCFSKRILRNYASCMTQPAVRSLRLQMGRTFVPPLRLHYFRHPASIPYLAWRGPGT